MIHFKRRWPFVEWPGTRAARLALEATVEQRPKVDALSDELVQRGRTNHFAEAWDRFIINAKE